MNGHWDSKNTLLTGAAVSAQARSATNDSHTNHGSNNDRRNILHWVFLVTLATLLAMGWSLHQTSTKAHESSGWVHHTHEVLLAISAIEEELNGAASAVRAYVASGNVAFLGTRDTALAALNDNMSNLAKLLSDNPEQQSRARDLRELVAERIAIMHETVMQDGAGGRAGATTTVASAQQAAERVQAKTREVREVEERLLRARRDEEAVHYQRTMWLLIAAGALALVTLIPSYIGFMLQARARVRIERKLFEMADSIPGVVYQCRSHADGTWHYEFLSSGVEALYGIERDAVLKDPSAVGSRVFESDRPALSAAVKKAAETLTPLEHEFRISLPTAETKWVRTSAAPRRGPDQSIVWNGHWADITAQKQLEHALHGAKATADTASHTKSTFLAVMSHEIRTPLNGVLGMLELLSLTRLDTDQRSTLTVVRESGKSLQRIIDDILDFSKIEAGKLDIASEPSSIRAALDSTCNIYSGNASSKGVLLQCTVDPQLSPAVLVDALRLRQILNNFVSNAIKFSSGGVIAISAELVERTGDSERVRFAVADHGIGMSAQVQARLFEPFTQGAAETTRTFGGTGLGLAICGRLADMMGGSIAVESEPDKGTTMILTLSLKIADPDSLETADMLKPGVTAIVPARSAPSIQQAEQERTLVLIVDDHPVNRMLLSRQIRLLGYACECANDGVEALQKWVTGRFGAVITDCNMPEMDGYQLARRIREVEAHNAGGRVPIVACTANALSDEAQACLEAGMDDYLAKPVSLPDLQKKLRQWLPLPQVVADEAAMIPSGGREDAAVFDRSVLAAITGGDEVAENEVLAEFQCMNSADATMLRQAFARSAFDEVTRASHRMKGASLMVGLAAVAAACEAVELASRHHDAPALERAMPVLEHALERAGEYISRHCAVALA